MRLFIVVEGQTEEQVVKGMIAPHLVSFNVFAVPVIVMTSKERGSGKKHKGGGRWAHLQNNLLRLSREQRGTDVRFTTLFDLYGLPSDFPGYPDAPGDGDTVRRATRLEAEMGAAIGDRRLIPYLQRHEVEALVMADLHPLEALIGDGDDGVLALRRDIHGLAPEEINDHPETAPSKRLLRFIPSYQKTLHGPLVIEAIGLPRLRAACPRFDKWIAALEALGSSSALAGPGEITETRQEP